MSQQKAEAVLNFIQEYITQNQIAPSVREICTGLGIRSTSTVHRYLHRLQEEGKLQMPSGKKRAVFVTVSRKEGIPVIAQVKPETALLDEENIQYYETPFSAQDAGNSLFAFFLTRDLPENGLRKGDMLIARTGQLPGKPAVILNQDGMPEIASGEPPADCSVVGTVTSIIRKF